VTSDKSIQVSDYITKELREGNKRKAQGSGAKAQGGLEAKGKA